MNMVVYLAILGAGGLGCYRPGIADGGFRCSDGAKPCPDGFSCELGTMTCRRGAAGGDAAPMGQDGAGAGAGDGGGGDARASDAGADAACLTPRAGCTPAAGTCDPVCQTGCGCGEKCSTTTAGTLTCNPPLGRAAVGDTCDISAPGAAAQSDDCDAGLVCVADGCGAGRCYRFCRTGADCPDSTCSREAGGGVKICDVPLVACDPVGRAAVTGCPTPSHGCYLAADDADRTLCDCPFGAQRQGDTCASSRDCLAGLVCVAPGAGSGASRCQPVCALAGGGGGCSDNRACTPIGGSRGFGYCPP